jgi:beta-N-acetylhexosaminidase
MTVLPERTQSASSSRRRAATGRRGRTIASLGCAARIMATVLFVVAPFTPRVASATSLHCDGPLSSAAIAKVDPDYLDLLRLVDSWPVQQRVGHLFVLGLSGTSFTDSLRDRIEHTTPAGVFLLGRNVQGREQLASLTEGIYSAYRSATGGVEPFVATDFEGGTVNALRAITGPTPSAQQLAGGGTDSVSARGEADAAVLRGLGINVNLAPVADIRPPDGGFIGSRAFATSATTVASLATAYAHGLRAGGIVPVLKHFPGHGRASGDSHILLPILAHDRRQLEEEDLRPFADALRAGEPGMVMVGHVLVPAIDPTSPASLSEPVVDGLLRHDLGFGGVVITDELKMRAVSEDRDVVQAATAAINAGVDLILSDYSPAEHIRVVTALKEACDRGDLSGERLATALARVLHLKSSFGLLTPEAARRVQAWRAERLTGSLAFQASGERADGRFFSIPIEVGPPTLGVGPGFTITDEQGIMLYRDYVNLGGASRLGRPLSRRFALGNDVVQLLEGGLLRWRPETGECDLYEGFDTFGAVGISSAAVQSWADANGWGRGPTVVDPAPEALPAEDVVLGAATGPATGHGAWVVRPYSRGFARVPLGMSATSDAGAQRSVAMAGNIAIAIETFPPDAIGPLPWSPSPTALLESPHPKT